MKRCFAMSKNSVYTLDGDKCKPDEIITCYALNEDDFRAMVKKRYCGTQKCPFFKEKRSEVRR